MTSHDQNRTLARDVLIILLSTFIAFATSYFLLSKQIGEITKDREASYLKKLTSKKIDLLTDYSLRIKNYYDYYNSPAQILTDMLNIMDECIGQNASGSLNQCRARQTRLMTESLATDQRINAEMMSYHLRIVALFGKVTNAQFLELDKFFKEEWKEVVKKRSQLFSVWSDVMMGVYAGTKTVDQAYLVVSDQLKISEGTQDVFTKLNHLSGELVAKMLLEIYADRKRLSELAKD